MSTWAATIRDQSAQQIDLFGSGLSATLTHYASEGLRNNRLGTSARAEGTDYGPVPAVIEVRKAGSYEGQMISDLALSISGAEWVNLVPAGLLPDAENWEVELSIYPGVKYRLVGPVPELSPDRSTTAWIELFIRKGGQSR